MDQSENLKLPYIMAAQAQKHVTHNEAIKALDAIVQLAVQDRDLTTQPVSPVHGDRYIVAASATDGWLGKDGQIAAWQDNAWLFYQPQVGWLAWVTDENKLLAWDGSGWEEVSGGGSGSVNPVSLLGVNATADSGNRFSVSSPNTLFSHEGNGHRVKVNKASGGDTASFLFQNGFEGRAEIGLTGDDDFHFKVSPDGTNWLESIVIDKSSGGVSFPNSALSISENLLVNGDFNINQRDFAGGALGDGNYGFDRWKAFGSGCSISESAGVISLTGTVGQVIEQPGLADEHVTVSVESPNVDLMVDVEGQTGTIIAGSGRRSTTLTMPGGSTGHVALKLAPTSGTATFSKVKLERGLAATTFESRNAGIELLMAQRYFFELNPVAAYALFANSVAWSTIRASAYFSLPVGMISTPVFSALGAFRCLGGAVLSVTDVVYYGDGLGGEMEFHVAGGFSLGSAYAVQANNDAGSKFKFDAEL